MSTSNEPCFLHATGLNRGLVLSFAVFPYAIPAIRTLESLKFHPRVTFFVDENGAGKSTLLETIALAEGPNADGGSRCHLRASNDDTTAW